ncbi:hypothetical protein TA3x_000685 [Tundrisphaera sp. TA3]|uniref:hypothetical protein n=1 Tax=Tundrisphaera sp. TA3 TaxID=3435775 RepID=UPI003EBF7FAC
MSSINPYDAPDDAFNPYMTPKAAPGRPGFAYEPGSSSLPFGVGEVFGRTWEIFKDQWAVCLGTVIGWWLICVVGVFIPLIALAMVGGTTVSMIPAGGPAVPGPNPNNAAAVQGALLMMVAGIVVQFAIGLFITWVTIGMAMVLMDIARGRQASFADIFAGGRYLLPVLVASILFTIMTAGASGLLMALAGGLASVVGSGDQGTVSAIFLVGMLVVVVGMTYVMIRLSQFYFLIIERGAGPLESLRLSVEATRGRVLGLLGLLLLSYLVNLGGFLACGIGALVTYPFTMLLFAVSYLSLVGGPVADPAGRGKPFISGDPLFEV